MAELANTIEKLIERATEYGISTYELFKLKAIYKITDVLSSILANYIVLFLFAIFLLFLNIGISLWLCDILGNTFYGFLVVAGFYAILGVLVHFFLHKSLKKRIGNFVVKQLLK